MSRDNKEIAWMADVAEHNYPSADSYLSLIFDPLTASGLITNLGLKHNPIVKFKARDIFRASGLPLLGISQHQIERNLKKIKRGESLSPILLIRDTEQRKVIVADGYHRLCAVYHHNDNLEIPCKITSFRRTAV